MGLNYLWDTNTVIYYLQRQFQPTAEKFIDDIQQTTGPAISVITEIELMCWKSTTDNDTKVLEGFIQDTLVIELDREIKLKTATLRRTNRIKLPDAIIAATALVHEITLITRNVGDFKGIDGLMLINPYDM